MSRPDPLAWVRRAAAARDAAGLRRVLRPRPATEERLDLGSNDYLGLARDRRVTAAAAAAAVTWGAGATGSRLVTGSTTLHARLECALAAFAGTEAALVFASGYAANLGAIAALAGPDALVVSDAYNHASIVDACRLSRSRVLVVPHADVAAVETALRARPEPRAVVVTDAVFSVDGDLAPLTALHDVARRHGALLVVDDAHGFGVVGGGGRGAAAAAGLTGAPDVVVTASLSKALGSQGGAVLAAQAVVDHLVNTARAFIFDTALAPPSAAAAGAALSVLAAEPERPVLARRHAAALEAAARAAGWAPTAPAAAVLSIPLATPDAVVAAVAAMREHGVVVGCFRPPSVPDGVSRLRLSARADLTAADLTRATMALATAARPPVPAGTSA